MAGYSGKPLVEKLGVRDGMRLAVVDPPAGYPLAAAWPSKGEVDFVHVFVITRAELEKAIATWRRRIARDGTIWISWPKRASKVPTDITEDIVREVALPTGLVDVKVCAVDEVWSGLKLVIRRTERSGAR